MFHVLLYNLRVRTRYGTRAALNTGTHNRPRMTPAIMVPPATHAHKLKYTFIYTVLNTLYRELHTTYTRLYFESSPGIQSSGSAAKTHSGSPVCGWASWISTAARWSDGPQPAPPPPPPSAPLSADTASESASESANLRVHREARATLAGPCSCGLTSARQPSRAALRRLSRAAEGHRQPLRPFWAGRSGRSGAPPRTATISAC